MNNTRNLSEFGNRERSMAGDLLNAMHTSNDTTRYLTPDNVAVEMNMMSGNVFLVDEDYNVAMMNGDKLEDWFNCPYCGHEGFKEDMHHVPDNAECTRYLTEIGVCEEDEEDA